MADIVPFRARRFRDPVTRDASACAAPPYDVIHGDEREVYAARSAANVVHLTLPVPRDGLDPYAAAAARLTEFCADGRLVPDAEPTLHLQDVTFRSPGDPSGALRTRHGFLALARVEPIGQGAILGHEEVLPKAIEDRWRLMTATRANLEPVFFLYRDPEGAIDALLAPVRERMAGVDVPLDGMRFRFGVAPPAIAHDVAARLAREPLYIADGHHRFTVSNRVREEHPEWPGARFRLALFVRAEDPGLVILPTHRFVDRLDDELRVALRELQDAWFDVERVDPLSLLDRLRDAPGSLGIWWRRSNEAFLARTKPTALLTLGAMPEPLRSLDVNVLHRGWWSPDALAGKPPACRYVRGEEDPLGLAVKDDVELAVFLRSPPVSTVIAVSDQRRFMPPKSTYFFPKAASGQVLYRFEDAPPP